MSDSPAPGSHAENSHEGGVLSRDALAARYFEQLLFTPYPVQEEALLAWFTSQQGVMVCAPTGTGKTLIAEAAVFEALHTREQLYYTTPLIALTDQKFVELQKSAERWGFSPDDVGLVTGNRKVNPQAPVLVVVAEILLNRLLHPTAFELADATAVVMDEFHSFNDPERGIVWEFTLGLLPKNVRLLLLSATVGNSREFVMWLDHRHQRRLELVESTERKVPLTYRWVDELLLDELLEEMVEGQGQGPLTPALVFCFNREECWSVAEQLKGKKLLRGDQQARVTKALEEYDFSEGAGPKLRQLLLRGVGVHHAGILPRYRRVVEDLFERKLLSIAVCTETLSAGINLPARSVVLPTLMKGPYGDKKLLDSSSAHQMFGRAGRPQFDDQGFVFVLAHEDDVKLLRWREKYDKIPEDTKDLGLMRAKKALKKKMPKRRTTEQYWERSHFEKLVAAPPRRLVSRGPLPWRLLAYMLDASPDVQLLRTLIDKRLLDSKGLEAGQKVLDRMLLTLWRGGYVELEPAPPKKTDEPSPPSPLTGRPSPLAPLPLEDSRARGTGGPLAPLPLEDSRARGTGKASPPPLEDARGPDAYRPERAIPTPSLKRLLLLRGINPLYGVFLVNQLGIADRNERLQAWESVLEMPRSLAVHVRVPSLEDMPAGPLATERLNPLLLQLGLVTAAELGAVEEDEDHDPRRRMFAEERPRVLTVAEKLRLLFSYDFPDVHEVRVQPVWVAGEVLEFGAHFNKYITARGLQKQEGLIFRHLLRLILLLTEFKELCPPEMDPFEWLDELNETIERMAECCRRVDPSSTDKALEEAELNAAEG